MTEISPEKHKKTVLFLPQKVRKSRIYLKSKMHVFLMPFSLGYHGPCPHLHIMTSSPRFGQDLRSFAMGGTDSPDRFPDLHNCEFLIKSATWFSCTAPHNLPFHQ